MVYTHVLRAVMIYVYIHTHAFINVVYIYIVALIYSMFTYMLLQRVHIYGTYIHICVYFRTLYVDPKHCILSMYIYIVYIYTHVKYHTLLLKQQYPHPCCAINRTL